MFRIVCDPSSGSTELCLTEITPSDSPCLHTAGSKLRCQIPTKHTKNIYVNQVISVKHSSVLPDDGSHTIRNMLE